MEMYAAFKGDAYGRAFETNWATCYPTLAVLGHASNVQRRTPSTPTELHASPSDAATAVLAVARVMGISETKLTQPLAEAVVHKLEGSVANSQSSPEDATGRQAPSRQFARSNPVLSEAPGHT